jgi:hypothetical protein
MAAQQQQRVVVKIPVRWLRQAATAITTGTGTGNVRTEQRLPTTRTIRAPVCYPLGSASFTTLPSPPPPLPGARMFQRGQNQPDETVRLVDMSMRCTACCLLCRPRQHGQEGLELDPCPTLSPPPALPLSHSPLRYCNNSYTDERRATTGADFATKKIVLQDTQMVTTTLVLFLFHAIPMLFPCYFLLWAPVCVGAVSDGDAVCCRGGATTTWGYKSRRRHANTRTRVSDAL